MQKIHREVLIHLREKITDDLNVHNGIINFLKLQNILSNANISQIDEGANDSAKAEILLDILPK